jgi:hypothetical protein
MPKAPIIRKHQRGQSLVFVLALTIPIMLATLMLYKTGKLTSEKMELQNAADAVAYSISVLEARDLNFASYMNRAMVANEVGIGQLVGLRSWANHFESYGSFIHNIGDSIGQVPQLRSVKQATKNIEKFFSKTGEQLEKGTQKLAEALIPATSGLNKGLGAAEMVYHLATALVILESMFSSDGVLEQNAPGAELSDFSKLSIMVHLGSYLGKYAKYYDPSSKKHKEGFSRLASIIRDSRDPFSESRSPPPGREVALYFLPPAIGRTPAPISFSPTLGVCSLICFKVRFELRMGLRLDHYGGSELRFKQRGTKTSAQGDAYGWTAADASTASLDIHFRFAVRIETAIGDADLFDFTTPALPGVPIGAGFAQAPVTTSSALTKLNLKSTDATAPEIDPAISALDRTDASLSKLSYGAAPTMTLAWNTGAILPPLGNPLLPYEKPVVSRFDNKITGYAGLPRYVDTVGPEEEEELKKFQMLAPYVLIGLVKNIDDVYGPQAPSTSGQMRLVGDGETSAAANQIAAIAKSEVYFKRATDLSDFIRSDGKEEYGSAFNPYWQARLTNTSEIDRMLSMLTQQQIVWLDTDMSGIQQAFESLINTVSATFDGLVAAFP